MNLAPWINRVGGYIIDVIPSYIISFIGGLVATNDDGTYGPLYYIFSLLSLAWVIYNRWILGGKGQSIGKKALGLHLIKEQTGQPIGALQAFLRDIVHILDTISCLVGWLFPLWDAKKQTFADKIMGTVVTKA